MSEIVGARDLDVTRFPHRGIDEGGVAPSILSNR